MFQALKDWLRPAYFNLRHFGKYWRREPDVERLAREVAARAVIRLEVRPVIFFKASTGIFNLTQNNAFHLLTAWSLRLQGVPVIHLVCHKGMQPCVLGTNRDHPYLPPPCGKCIAFAQVQMTQAEARPFKFIKDAELAAQLAPLDLQSLMGFERIIAMAGSWESLPLGQLCLPGLRWILRRHNLHNDEPTRFLLRGYILSAWSIAQAFVKLVEEIKPQAVVVFNGQFYPEAVVRWVAQKHGIRAITHEVGLQPFTAFFTEGEATAYPVHIPEEFDLSPEQDARLDAYLEKRFQGQFSMAGVRFWPEIRGLDEKFLQKAAGFKQIVPVFTNVVFDTSQPHANTVFSDMFAWLDLILETARAHPETLFVIRAHPDENRMGKQSLESVAGWANRNHVTQLPNIVFVAPNEYISSYELIQRSKFILIYNSTIGLEASIMGIAVLCAGKARFTQYPTVFFPQTVDGYRKQFEDFLVAEHIEVPAEHRRQARRFLYYQLFRTSLSFGEYVEASERPSLVHLKPFNWDELLPENSQVMQILRDGILAGTPFLMDER